MDRELLLPRSRESATGTDPEPPRQLVNPENLNALGVRQT